MKKRQRVPKGRISLVDFEDNSLEAVLHRVKEQFGDVSYSDLIFKDNYSEWDSNDRWRLVYSPIESEKEMKERVARERKEDCEHKRLIKERELRQLAELKAKYEKEAE